MIQPRQHLAKDRKSIKRLAVQEYRNAFLEAQVRTWVAYQIRALRKKLGLSQVEMAKKLDKPQSVVSRLEDESYGRVSLQTLLDVAQAMDVALLVQFVSYPDFLDRMRDKSEKAMQPDNISETSQKLDRETYSQKFVQIRAGDVEAVVSRRLTAIEPPNLPSTYRSSEKRHSAGLTSLNKLGI